MNCQEVRKNISALVDNEIDQDLKKDLMKHIENCKECQSIYEEEQLIKEVIFESELEELPYGFESRLHEALEEVTSTNEKKNENKILHLFKKNKKYLAIAAVFVFSIVLINNLPMGLGSSNNSMDMAVKESVEESVAMEDIARSEEEMAVEATTTLGEVDNQVDFATKSNEAPMEEAEPVLKSVREVESSEYQTGRVIIKNGNLHLDILDLEETMQLINNQLEGYNGYISNMSTNVNYIDPQGNEFRSGYLQVKIESIHFESFMDYAKDLGRIKNTNVSSNDITNQYRDTVSRIKNLEITQQRLRDLLKESQSVEETLQIERELTRIRGQLDQLEGNIKNWDRLSQFSTINIHLNEVKSIDISIEPIDENIFDKAIDGLMNTVNNIRHSLERLFIWLVAYSPIIIIGGLVLIFIRIKFKKGGKQ